MPFRFSPHNHYLALWFNLGLVGLIYRRATCCSPPSGAHAAPAWKSRPPVRGQLIAFVVGAIAVCAAVFFVDLYDPWYYFWMYTGVVMRMVFCVEARAGGADVGA